MPVFLYGDPEKNNMCTKKKKKKKKEGSEIK